MVRTSKRRPYPSTCLRWATLTSSHHTTYKARLRRHPQTYTPSSVTGNTRKAWVDKRAPFYAKQYDRIAWG